MDVIVHSSFKRKHERQKLIREQNKSYCKLCFQRGNSLLENTSYSLYAQTLNFCFSEKVADSKAPKCKTLEGQNHLEQFIHCH